MFKYVISFICTSILLLLCKQALLKILVILNDKLTIMKSTVFYLISFSMSNLKMCLFSTNICLMSIPWSNFYSEGIVKYMMKEPQHLTSLLPQSFDMLYAPVGLSSLEILINNILPVKTCLLNT